jgi:hypothetical protein
MIADRYVELRGFHDYVLECSERRLEAWLSQGFVRVPDWCLFGTLCMAFDQFTPPARYAEVWRRLFPYQPVPPCSCYGVELALARAARDPIPALYVLERRIERGIQLDMPKFEAPPLPPRTTTDHYVVVEAAADTDSTPVAGLRLELLIADGEIKNARTDANGVARVERIQAARAVIRVLDLDGARWRPLDGEASQPSGSSERAHVHVVQPGECLSKIAARYGASSWHTVWDHPGNQQLRQKRKIPHVLLPGDAITVPPIAVHEIVRPTDATHRIVVSCALATFQVVLQDHNQQPFRDEPYELRVPGQANTRRGATASDGRITERLPVHVQRVDVRLPRPGLSWSFALSSLIASPHDDAEHQNSDGTPSPHAVIAAQARLNALGFPCGAVDGVLGPRTRAALALLRGDAAHARASDDSLAFNTSSALHDLSLA